jgi:hypothetical protein
MAETEVEAKLDYAAWIIARARDGWGRAEIADSMQMTLQGLRDWEASDAAIAEALRKAETSAQAWWELQYRDALIEGAQANAGAWLAAMEWRFGDAKSRAKAALRVPTARYEIPDNGKERRPRRR